MKAVVVGTGAVGARAARHVLGTAGLAELVVVDTDAERSKAVASSLGEPATAGGWDPSWLVAGDVAVLTLADGHAGLAADAVRQGASVVSTADTGDDVRALLGLDQEARTLGATVATGAGFAPGYSCILARHAAAGFDTVEEVHVAKAGTGGPACARHHHGALTTEALDWRDGEWLQRRGGSGRELCWFPEPLGALDCYRAGLPDALLLVPAFPGVERVTARVAASRRDRLTARLPMLRQPHPEGLLGAVRVEVRGWRGPVTDVRVLGALDRPAIAAGMVAGLTASWLLEGRLTRPGSAGLGQVVPEPVPFLQELARRGLRAAAFVGAGPAAVAATPRA
ncbi:MAG: hypothetical protein ACRD0N_03560 [Acidimicrobiales bacterium]